jgi:hypothetical protein
MNLIDDCKAQITALDDYFDVLADRHHILPLVHEDDASAAAANDARTALAA